MTLHTFKLLSWQFRFIRACVAFINKSGAELWMRSKQSKQYGGNHNHTFYTQVKMAV